MVYNETKDDTRSGFAVPTNKIWVYPFTAAAEYTGLSYFSFLSEAIDNNQSVVLMVAKVTIDTDRWKIGNGNIYSVTSTMIT